VEKPVIERAIQAWKKVTRERSPEPLKHEIDLFRKMLGIFHVGDYFHLIFNVVEPKIEYCDQGVYSLLGYEPKAFTIEHLLNSIHPDDLPYFLDFERRAADFFHKLPPDKVQRYKVRYDYRMRAKSGEYKRVMQQVLPIQSDAEGAILRTIGVFTDISAFKSNTSMTLAILGLDGEPSYPNLLSYGTRQKDPNPLSRREMEVLQMVADGKSSKQIAEDLSISLHTVHNHRKNMLRKVGVKSSAALLSKALENEWVL
jgi:DNA-binding CsgD family transcriptional regulator